MCVCVQECVHMCACMVCGVVCSYHSAYVEVQEQLLIPESLELGAGC